MAGSKLMVRKGLDYSGGPPRGRAVKAAGYDFVIRYLSYPGNPKNATRAEVADMLANGVGVALVFETTAERAREGRPAGIADATSGVAQQATLGVPSEMPIFYAVDFDADPIEIIPYFQGLNAVIGPDAVYGSYRVVKAVSQAHLVVVEWQAAAWSYGQQMPGIDVFQKIGAVVVDGVQCDVNLAYTDTWWWAGGEGDDMFQDTDRTQLSALYPALARGETTPGQPADPAHFAYSLLGLRQRMDTLAGDLVKRVNGIAETQATLAKSVVALTAQVSMLLSGGGPVLSGGIGLGAVEEAAEKAIRRVFEDAAVLTPAETAAAAAAAAADPPAAESPAEPPAPATPTAAPPVAPVG